MECGIPHSTFHIPMHFSMVGVRYSQKDNSIFHIPKFWNGNWNVDFHIPNSEFQTLGIGIGIGIGIGNSSTFQIPFHSYSIVFVTNLFTMLFDLSPIPIPQWMGWNMEFRFDIGCCLGLLFGPRRRSAGGIAHTSVHFTVDLAAICLLVE